MNNAYEQYENSCEKLFPVPYDYSTRSYLRLNAVVEISSQYVIYYTDNNYVLKLSTSSSGTYASPSYKFSLYSDQTSVESNSLNSVYFFNDTSNVYVWTKNNDAGFVGFICVGGGGAGSINGGGGGAGAVAVGYIFMNKGDRILFVVGQG